MVRDCNFVGVENCIGVGAVGIVVGAVGIAVAGELGRLVRGLGQPGNDCCCCYRLRSWDHCNADRIAHHRIDRRSRCYIVAVVVGTAAVGQPGYGTVAVAAEGPHELVQGVQRANDHHWLGNCKDQLFGKVDSEHLSNLCTYFTFKLVYIASEISKCNIYQVIIQMLSYGSLIFHCNQKACNMRGSMLKRAHIINLDTHTYFSWFKQA